MAIVKFGGGVTGIRGNLGGNIFSANKNGAYVRPWSGIRNPKTLYQTINRMYAGQIPTLWRALDPGQRTDWNDYGEAHALTNPLGDTYYRTGFQWFFSCAQNMLVIGGTPPTDAPTDPAPDAVVGTSVYYDDDGLFGRCQLNFDSDDFTGLWCIFLFRPFTSTGVLSSPSGYTLLRADYEPGGDNVNASLNAILKWGYPQVGWKGFFWMIAGDNQGLRSAPWAASLEYSLT